MGHLLNKYDYGVLKTVQELWYFNGAVGIISKITVFWVICFVKVGSISCLDPITTS